MQKIVLYYRRKHNIDIIIIVYINDILWNLSVNFFPDFSFLVVKPFYMVCNLYYKYFAIENTKILGH